VSNDVQQSSEPDSLGLGPRQVMAQLAARAKNAEAQKAESDKTIRTLIFCLSGAIVLPPLAAWAILNKYPLDRYMHTDNAKAICEAQMSSVPLITTNTVLDFAKDCALEIDTFAYDTVEQSLSRMANRCLTPNFRDEFFKQPWLGDRIATVKRDLLRVSSQTTGPVLVESSGDTPNGFMWRVQIPVKRSYRQGEAVKGNNERVYIMDVYRVVKEAYNPVGLGINAVNEKSATR